MTPIRLDVQTPSRAYPIHIGTQLLTDRSLYPGTITPHNTIVVTNEVVAELYLEPVLHTIGPGTRQFVIADGESHKTLDTCGELLDAMLGHHLGRDCTLIALGGGVVGDLTGFAAAIYQRGINFVQVPTTLLAQVDSSVGGKTAVNRPLGKNMVGAFHQPLAVITDLSTLDTLPQRELLAGLAEVIKYGLLGDARFFDWLDANLSGLLAREPDLLAEAVHVSCAHKARIVAQDEREAGIRALLNLGHTFGHAIEAHLHYQGWLHGEAVATGMLMAADMSARENRISAAARDRIESMLERAGLPTRPPAGLDAEQMLNFMRGDKKNLGGQIRLILLDEIGQACLSADYSTESLLATLNHFCVA